MPLSVRTGYSKEVRLGGLAVLLGLRRPSTRFAVAFLVALAIPFIASGAAPDFTITATSASMTVAPGFDASYTINLASINGFSGQVNLIPSVFSGAQGVGVNARMNRVYVADWQSNSLSVIDSSTDRVLTSIPVVLRPDGVAVNPSTNKTYVTSANYRGVSVVNDATNTLDYNIDAPPGLAVAVNPVTNRIYTANTTAVTVIDASTRTIVGSVVVGFLPTGIAVNYVTNRIYVGSQNTNDVSVIDGSTNAVIATIPVTYSPGTFGVDVNPRTNRIYVTNLNGPISVIDGSTNTIVANIPVVGTLTALVVNPVLNEVYVSDQFSYFGGPPPTDKVAILNATSNMQIASVVVGSVPSGIGVDQISGRIYVDNENSDTLSVIDTSTFALVDAIILDPTISANPSTVILSSSGIARSTVTVSTYPDTKLGTYNFYVYGSSSVGFHFIVLTLTVGDFALSPGSSSLSVPRGLTSSSTITIDSLNGNWIVNLTAVGGSPSLNLHVNPSTLSIGPSVSGSSTVTVDTSGVGTTGNYTIAITGTSGRLFHSATMLLRITDFAISATSARLTMSAGSKASLVIATTPLNGFSGTTSLAVSSSPTGLSCNLNVTRIELTMSANSLLTCTGAAGNYTVVVTATSSPLVHSIEVPVTVNEAGGGGPPATAAAGGLEIYLVAILVAGGVMTLTVIYLKRVRRRKSSVGFSTSTSPP
jgi:YVTN family beta-propeller protein